MQLSVWEKESFYAPADIIIAGGGFAGLWSAFYLIKKNPTLRITLVDRGIFPTGASTRNAGFACFGSVTELLSDASEIGEDKMLELVEMRFSGLSAIRQIFKKKEIDYEACGGYELINATTTARIEELSAQINGLNKKLYPITGKKSTYDFTDDKIKKFGFHHISHLIRTKQEGSLHPGKLCQELLRKIQAMGVNVIFGLEIIRYEQESSTITVFTSSGISLKTQKLIVCTNVFAQQLLPEIQVIPARGQVLVTSPINALKIKGTFHYDQGFYYFRNLGNRLLIGGARNTAIEQEATDELCTTENIQHTLEAFISRHLLAGITFTVTDRWSGIMGMGTEKMPIVKKISENVYCAVQLSGMGVALAPVVGKKIATLVS